MTNPEVNQRLSRRDKIALGIMSMGSLLMYVGLGVEYSNNDNPIQTEATAESTDLGILLVSGGALTTFAGLLTVNCAAKRTPTPEIQFTSQP